MNCQLPIDLPTLASLRPQNFPPFFYIGRINCVTGQGVAARHQLHILRKYGFCFRVVEAGSCGDPDPEGCDSFVQAARQSDTEIGTTAGTVIHLQPNMAELFRVQYPRPHILISVWETTRLPTDWVALINRYDQVWCATEWQKQIYRNSGVDEHRLRFVPFAIDPALYSENAITLSTSHHRTVFGSVFQWTERKNPRALIAGYLEAFTADDDVLLILKVYEGDSPENDMTARVAKIADTLTWRPPGKRPQMQIVSRGLSTREMTTFYRSLNCYVSTTCGEGFGFPIAEALLSGIPVITTNWSAPAEYAADCFRGLRFLLAPPHGMDWQPFYTQDQRWAHVDVSDLIRALREAHAGQLTCPTTRVRERFSALVTQAGTAAQAALMELCP